MSEYPPDATRTPYVLSTYTEAHFSQQLRGLPPGFRRAELVEALPSAGLTTV